MKKIYYLLAFVALAFVSCNPLDNTYKALDATPAPQTLTLTITTSYASTTAAKAGIPTLLNTKYGDYANGSTATITFPLPTTVPLVADSLYAHVAYTLLPADYTFPGNTFADLSASAVINYLNYKYPTPAANQLAVLTYLYFETNVTASTGTTTTDSFLYLNGAWAKIYTVSPTQYASVNRGVDNFFSSTDQANFPSYFNAFLLNDPRVMATAKAGDIIYVSFRYTATYQKVLPMMFNGTTWVDKSTLNFLKLNGTWVPDPTVYVTEPAVGNNPDMVFLSGTSIGSAAARANVLQYGDFNIESSSQYYWSDTDLQAAFAAILLHKFPTPTQGIPYKVTYYAYTGSDAAVTKTYYFNGTAFIYTP